MDGGIDLAYSLHFGWDMEERLRARIAAALGGALPVGMALIVETEAPSIPWLISAPTMRVPMDVAGTANAYLAMRAALRAALAHTGSPPIRSVLCPGLGDSRGGLAGAVRRHMDLVR